MKGNTQVVPSVVRQGFGTRLLRLTSDPGKFRGLPWTVTKSRASTVALEEMEEEKEEQEESFMILLCQTDDFPSQPVAFIGEFLWASLPIYKETDRISRISSDFKSPILLLDERMFIPLSHLSWSV